MPTNRDWFDDGALLIFMPSALTPQWDGSDSDAYDRACDAADDWLVPFNIAGATGFLLGGDPGMALLLNPPDAGEPTLVRWIYADDEEALIDVALRREGIKQTQPDIIIHNAHENWVLFNSVWNPSIDRPLMRQATLPLGPLIIDTALLEAGPNSAIVHRFRTPTNAQRSGLTTS
jgi:hypothetical protein